MNSSRTYPIKEEVHELRKHRGNENTEKSLKSYKDMKNFSKASGTWGIKNAKSKALSKAREASDSTTPSKSNIYRSLRLL